MNIKTEFLKLVDDSPCIEAEIISRRRVREYVDARQMIAIELRQMGFLYKQIGGVMNRHYTSIQHLCNDRPTPE